MNERADRGRKGTAFPHTGRQAASPTASRLAYWRAAFAEHLVSVQKPFPNCQKSVPDALKMTLNWSKPIPDLPRMIPKTAGFSSPMHFDARLAVPLPATIVTRVSKS